MILGIDASNIRAGGAVAHLQNLLHAAQPEHFGPSEGDSWTMKTDDRQPETIPNYEEMLVLVRKLLK